MKNKKIKKAEEMYIVLSHDFKDDLAYEVEIEGFKEMSAVQKWLIYDRYAKRDADVVIRNRYFADMIDWDVKWLDGIFPVRQIIRTLLNTIGQKIDVDTILDSKKEIYDIIGGKALTEKLHDAGIGNHVRSWHYAFSQQLEKFCKNADTVGNYMPCPDSDYGRVKGFNPEAHYNDRIDLLYSDILEPWCKKENGDYLIPQERRKKWKAWFDENKARLLLTEILDEKTRAELGKFGCIKHKSFSGDELKELPEYLKKVNQLIEHRTEKIKAICTEVVYNMYFECYKNTLSEFEHGKIFLQVCSFSKGYVWVAPECEKKFESGALGELFNLERGKYFNKKPIDKAVGETSWENFFEYAYLPLYDCCIGKELSAEKDWGLDYLKDRAAYFAFKEHDLVKDYHPHYG